MDIYALSSGAPVHAILRTDYQVPAAHLSGAISRNQWVRILRISFELRVVLEIFLTFEL
jgi:hypothetical protein